MKWLKNNGLTVVFFLLFVLTLAGQIFTGFRQYNSERQEKGAPPSSIGRYLGSGDFIETTFENWESEFLQMAMFVVATIFLYQKGSSESKDPEKKHEDVDRVPNTRRKGAPWPVKRGGWFLKIYQHSLTIALVLLFLLSFFLHFYGSLKGYNEDQVLKGKVPATAAEYWSNSKFWFESFQNWQSEFLSIFSIILLSIYLRQKGSPQSKPVDDPHFETEG